LGADEVKLVRETIGWEHDPFVIPAQQYEAWNANQSGKELEQVWNDKLATYREKYPELATELTRRIDNKLPDNWQTIITDGLKQVTGQAESVASRKASQNSLNLLGPALPELIGGSADLAGSNLTIWSGSRDVKKDHDGNYIYYGVREFAMAAINNGISLHGGFIPYSATFLIFSDYARNAMRMAALMKQRSIFVLTHDSIGLGEDGPTHQVVEQTASLRLIPNMSVWRPCDTVETFVAWIAAIENKSGPTSLMLSRQGLPYVDRDAPQLDAIKRGGYTLVDGHDTPDVILIATGSEVGIAMDAASTLNAQGNNIRVVSMPSTDTFDQQDDAYKESVLPSRCEARIAVEAGIPDGWHKYVGLKGKILGVPHFGASAPAKDVYAYFGITSENLIKMIQDYLK
jgi:transketolase